MRGSIGGSPKRKVMLMDDQPRPRDLHTATVRELLVELEIVEKERQRSDCFRLRSRERAVCAELRLRRAVAE